MSKAIWMDKRAYSFREGCTWIDPRGEYYHQKQIDKLHEQIAEMHKKIEKQKHELFIIKLTMDIISDNFDNLKRRLEKLGDEDED